jgi:hypothetical protein
MRKKLLTAAMLMFGGILILGAVVSVLPTSLVPVDAAVGSNASVAAGALGIGICVAAVDPVTNISWVRISILYALLVVVYQVVAHFALGLSIAILPIGVGLFFAVLMIALYPSRESLTPPVNRPAGHRRWLDPDY